MSGTRRIFVLNPACWWLTLMLLSTFHVAANGGSEANQDEDAFFESLSTLCGTTFVGTSVFPEDPGDPFRDKVLTAEFRYCSANEIRVPFNVGKDTSRTWIFSKTADGIRLKHDHRHEDGKPDEITDYGGLSQASTSEFERSFPADAYTASLIPEASTNVWTIRISEDGSELTYHLERHQQPRFTAKLVRQ